MRVTIKLLYAQCTKYILQLTASAYVCGRQNKKSEILYFLELIKFQTCPTFTIFLICF